METTSEPPRRDARFLQRTATGGTCALCEWVVASSTRVVRTGPRCHVGGPGDRIIGADAWQARGGAHGRRLERRLSHWTGDAGWASDSHVLAAGRSLRGFESRAGHPDPLRKRGLHALPW